MAQTNLQKQEALSSAESLQQAFLQFSKVSSTLTQAYSGLEARINQLTGELAEARSQKLHEYEERERVTNRLENLLTVLPGAVIVIDGEGVIQECNPTAAELFENELIGKRWRDIVSRLFRPQWDDGHDVTLINGRCVNISTQSLGSEPGQILLVTDVTETRQLQEQISGLKRVSAMGEMAAAMAHQIRTPLSSALLYVSNLGSSKLDGERRNRFLNRAMGSLQHLEKLVEEMLLFARGGQLNTKPTSVSKLLGDFASQQHQERLTLTITNELDEAIQANLSRDAFISALQNLVNNAHEAAATDLTIRIHAGISSDGEIAIQITDNGPGIPDTIKSRLFEPFVTTRANGTGLGLAVVNAVVRAHQGRITAKDASPTGTSFTITLPVFHNSAT